MATPLQGLFEKLTNVCIVLNALEDLILHADTNDAHDCIVRGHCLSSRKYKVSALIDALEAIWDHIEYSTATYDCTDITLITENDVYRLVEDWVPLVHIELNLADQSLFLVQKQCIKDCPGPQLNAPVSDAQVERLMDLVNKYPNKITD